MSEPTNVQHGLALTNLFRIGTHLGMATAKDCYVLRGSFTPHKSQSTKKQ